MVLENYTFLFIAVNFSPASTSHPLYLILFHNRCYIGPITYFPHTQHVKTHTVSIRYSSRGTHLPHPRSGSDGAASLASRQCPPASSSQSHITHKHTHPYTHTHTHTHKLTPAEADPAVWAPPSESSGSERDPVPAHALSQGPFRLSSRRLPPCRAPHQEIPSSTSLSLLLQFSLHFTNNQ